MIVYDLEIIRAIPDKRRERIEGIKYCEGWGNHAGMGVSVLCAYDSSEDRYSVFLRDNSVEWDRLVTHGEGPFVSFNGINFDNKVLEANGWFVPSPDLCLDLSRECRVACDLDPDGFNVPRSIGKLSLDAMCIANQLGTKGEEESWRAPIWWQQGQHGRVFNYCLHDVALTCRLFRLASTEGELVFHDGIKRAIVLPRFR